MIPPVIPPNDSQNQTIQHYTQQSSTLQPGNKKKSQTSIRHSADMNNNYTHHQMIQKSHSISRPLSQLSKQQQHLIAQSSAAQTLMKTQKDRSQGKLRMHQNNNQHHHHHLMYQNPISQFFDLTGGHSINNGGSLSHNNTQVATVDQLFQTSGTGAA